MQPLRFVDVREVCDAPMVERMLQKEVVVISGDGFGPATVAVAYFGNLPSTVRMPVENR